MATSTKSRGLGRGLGELFQRTDLDPVPAMRPEPGEGRPSTGSGRITETPVAEVPDP